MTRPGLTPAVAAMARRLVFWKPSRAKCAMAALRILAWAVKSDDAEHMFKILNMCLMAGKWKALPDEHRADAA
ncbi:hypothetical protein GCM10010486_71790 [Nonomuraea roseoviolacea subsp. carminata]